MSNMKTSLLIIDGLTDRKAIHIRVAKTPSKACYTDGLTDRISFSRAASRTSLKILIDRMKEAKEKKPRFK